MLFRSQESSKPSASNNNSKPNIDKGSDIVETGLAQNEDLLLAAFVGAILVLGGLLYYRLKGKKNKKDQKTS